MSNSQKILLIDYDPESIESTRGPLVKAGYEVEVACDGIAGIEAFERLKPDLVLIEPMVPKKHGFQVCQEIKSTAAGRNTPVLITTAFYRGRKHRDEAQESYGCDDYLEKPIAEELLLSTCGKFLIDTQEPPLPISADREQVAPSAEPVKPERDTSVSTELVVGMPDIPIPEDKEPSRIPALDDLSEDEIQERLDAMIIGEDPPPPSPPAATVESLLSKTAAETSTPAAAPFAAEESPARSRLPLWIGVAAGVLIVVGAGLLWMLRDKGAADPSIEVAAMSSGVSSSTSSRATPGPPAAIFPTVPVLGTDEADAIVGPEPIGSASSGPDVVAPPVARPARTVGDPAPPTTNQNPTTNPSSSSPTVVAGAIVTQERRGSDAPAGTAPAAVNETVTPPATPDRREQAADTMADGRVTPVEAVTGIETDVVPSTVDTPAPAIDETPSATSAPAAIQDDPPVVPLPVTETAPPIETVAEPVVPKTQRGDLVNLSEVDQAPAAREKPMPQYPPGARSMRQEGTVNLRLLVDEKGRVEALEIDSGTKSKQLQRAATEAAKRWVYDPGIKDGVPVKVWIAAAVRFKL